MIPWQRCYPIMIPEFLVTGYDVVDRALPKASFAITALGFNLRKEHAKQDVILAYGLESFFGQLN